MTSNFDLKNILLESALLNLSTVEKYFCLKVPKYTFSHAQWVNQNGTKNSASNSALTYKD